jgi:hypothetical protein
MDCGPPKGKKVAGLACKRLQLWLNQRRRQELTAPKRTGEWESMSLLLFVLCCEDLGNWNAPSGKLQQGRNGINT